MHIATSAIIQPTQSATLPGLEERIISLAARDQWQNLLASEIDRCSDPVKLWKQSFYPKLRYLCGLISFDHVNANLRPYHAQTVTKLADIANPNSLSMEDLKSLGDFLRQAWERKGWSAYWGQLDQYFVSLANTPVYPVERFYTGEERIGQFCGSEAYPRLLQLYTRGISLVAHLRTLGMHIDDKVLEPVDNVLLVETAREYLPLWLALRETLREKQPEATPKYDGPRLTQNLADFFDWGALVLLDPFVHDISRSAFSENATLKRMWPKGREESIPHYMLQIFEPLMAVDKEGEPTGALLDPNQISTILKKLLNTNWQSRGLRFPTCLNVSSFELDLSKGRFSPQHERPIAQSIFMFALHPPVLGFGAQDHEEPFDEFQRELSLYLP